MNESSKTSNWKNWIVPIISLLVAILATIAALNQKQVSVEFLERNYTHKLNLAVDGYYADVWRNKKFTDDAKKLYASYENNESTLSLSRIRELIYYSPCIFNFLFSFVLGFLVNTGKKINKIVITSLVILYPIIIIFFGIIDYFFLKTLFFGDFLQRFPDVSGYKISEVHFYVFIFFILSFFIRNSIMKTKL